MEPAVTVPSTSSSQPPHVIPPRPAADLTAVAGQALAAVHRHLARCKLAPNTVRAYRRQTTAYVSWLTSRRSATRRVRRHGGRRGRRHRLAPPPHARQGLPGLDQPGPGRRHPAVRPRWPRVAVKRARVSRPGEPDALTPAQQGAAERAATRRGARDAAILAVLLYAGAREEECSRLDAEDIATTARTGTIRLHGKGEGPLEEALAHHCSTPISPSRARRRRRLRLRTRPPSCR